MILCWCKLGINKKRKLTEGEWQRLLQNIYEDLCNEDNSRFQDENDGDDKVDLGDEDVDFNAGNIDEHLDPEAPVDDIEEEEIIPRK